MGEGGVEPPRPFGHTDLNRARLPFRHSPECDRKASTQRPCRPVARAQRGYDQRPEGRGSGVGVLQRFERRLEGLVEGAFARAFKAASCSRSRSPRAPARGRRPEGHRRRRAACSCPTTTSSSSAPADAERLARVRRAAAPGARRHGPRARPGAGLVVRRAGRGRVRDRRRPRHRRLPGPQQRRPTGATAAPSGTPAADRAARSGSTASPGDRRESSRSPRRRSVIGRGADADLRLADTGVSASTPSSGSTATRSRCVDLGSTNGTPSTASRSTAARCSDGDRIDVGATRMRLPARGD